MSFDKRIESIVDKAALDSSSVLECFSSEVQRAKISTATMSRDNLRWDGVDNSPVDEGPQFLSCGTFDSKSRYFYGVVSLEKNRFCELVRLSTAPSRWAGCTRTRHFRPPKRIGSAAVMARGNIFIFGGYELSNHLTTEKSWIDRSQQNIRERDPDNMSLLDNEPPVAIRQDVLAYLFGYPQWWFDTGEKGQGYCQGKTLNSLVGTPLGDFHAYDCVRGEWNVIISRDQTPMPTTENCDNANVCAASTNCYRSSFTSTERMPPIHCGQGRLRIANLKSGNLAGEPLPQPRAFHTIAKFSNNTIILFGGERLRQRDDDCRKQPTAKNVIEYLNDVWICDMRDLRWRLATARPPMSMMKPLEPLVEQPYSEPALSQMDWCCNSNLRKTTVSTASSYADNSTGFFHARPNQSLDAMTTCTTSELDGCGRECSPCGAPSVQKCYADAGLHRPEARSGHTAVCHERSMYIFGGHNTEMKALFSDCWLFNLKNHLWFELKARGASPCARVGHTAVVAGQYMCIYGGLSEVDMQKIGAQLHRPGQDLSNDRFKFSDDHALYLLNLSTLVWNELSTQGKPPHDARIFGRLHGYFDSGRLYFGGPTKYLNKAYEAAEIDVSDVCPFNLSATSSISSFRTTTTGSAISTTSSLAVNAKPASEEARQTQVQQASRPKLNNRLKSVWKDDSNFQFAKTKDVSQQMPNEIVSCKSGGIRVANDSNRTRSTSGTITSSDAGTANSVGALFNARNRLLPQCKNFENQQQFRSQSRDQKCTLNDAATQKYCHMNPTFPLMPNDSQCDSRSISNTVNHSNLEFFSCKSTPLPLMQRQPQYSDVPSSTFDNPNQKFLGPVFCRPEKTEKPKPSVKHLKLSRPWGSDKAKVSASCVSCTVGKACMETAKPTPCRIPMLDSASEAAAQTSYCDRSAWTRPADLSSISTKANSSSFSAEILKVTQNVTPNMKDDSVDKSSFVSETPSAIPHPKINDFSPPSLIEVTSSRMHATGRNPRQTPERIVLDVACVSRLQREAAVAWEENQLLKETLLTLIPYLHVPELGQPPVCGEQLGTVPLHEATELSELLLAQTRSLGEWMTETESHQPIEHATTVKMNSGNLITTEEHSPFLQSQNEVQQTPIQLPYLRNFTTNTFGKAESL